jgi:hypothetical protein
VCPHRFINIPGIRQKHGDQGHFGAFELTGTVVAMILGTPAGISNESCAMRRITTITVLVLVLLFGLVVSRLLDVTVSPSANRMDKSGSSMDSTLIAKEKLRSEASPHDSIGKAGGIWFW